MFRLTDELALVQTIDFFTPIVDDPYDFGRIAAANALSDVYAMGGDPAIALNVVCFPDETFGPEVLGEILRGGHDVVHEAGAVIGGGHSVSDKELKYGLAVTGTIHPDRIWANEGARPGDVLLLTKAVGTGVLATALKKGKLDEAGTEHLVASMTTLNRDASMAARDLPEGTVHAATDITGNGLLGHAIEVARASGVRLSIDASAVPVLDGALQAARKGFLTRGETGNMTYLDGQASFARDLDRARRSLLLDPQTSGGLLLFVDPSVASALPGAVPIGVVTSGPPGIDVLP